GEECAYIIGSNEGNNNHRKNTKADAGTDTTGVGYYPPLPTYETTTGGNALGKPSYANATCKPSGKKLNICTLFTPGGNGIDVVVLAESIRAIRTLGVNMGLFAQCSARLPDYSPFNLAPWTD
ncbi:hypothetical protein Tco_0147401, partial [Tanacetum coccineum]